MKNKSLKGEIELIEKQEESLNYFENHLSCIKGLLNQYKIESFERSMSSFSNELTALKYMVSETLAAGSNYLFAKYDSVVSENSQEEMMASEFSNSSSNSNTTTTAYNRILTEMAGLSADQTVEQVEGRRREISLELAEKTKISTISDFEVIQSLFLHLS